MRTAATIRFEDLDGAHDQEDSVFVVVAEVNRLNAPLLRRTSLLLAEVTGSG